MQQIAFPPNTQVGPFLLQRELSNEGNTAWVYLAVTSESPVRQVVLKIARADGEFKLICERFLRHEAEVLTDYRHPGIVRIYPIYFHGRSFYVGKASALAQYLNNEAPWYIALERLAGGSLEDHRQRVANYPLEWKVELIYQVATILDYLHMRKLAHLDLKPSNILFRATPRPDQLPQVVLIDFGIAEKRALDAEFKAITPPYGSPERIEEVTGERASYRTTQTQEINHTPSDVWSLGVISFELLTGHYPFKNTQRKTALAQSIFNDVPPSMRKWGVPTELERLINDMLSKIREQRPEIDQVIRRIDTDLPIRPPRLDGAAPTP